MQFGFAPESRRDLAANARRMDELFAETRMRSVETFHGFSAEDAQVQSMLEASPLKWHLAHTNWYFETFVLEAFESGFQPFDPQYRMLFNSYYVGVGKRPDRAARGMLTRPSLDRVMGYRQNINERMRSFLAGAPSAEALDLLRLGIAHEEQHQELMLTDGKDLLSRNPLEPVWKKESWSEPTGSIARSGWHEHPGGRVVLGANAQGFAFDNELPSHEVLLMPFALANRCVTAGEYLEFLEDGGYSRPDLWLSEGWGMRESEHWEAPHYWRREAHGKWSIFTHHGRCALDLEAPAVHLSYYEADAYARWAGFRLPREAEWEQFARSAPLVGNFAQDLRFMPTRALAEKKGPSQLFGDVWEWTQSPHMAYPGYIEPSGAIGEYNGKFMVNQMVLRGGSCVTARSHMRASYRNFFHPQARWQFSGIRLAKDL